MKRLLTVLVVGLSLITTPATAVPRDQQCRMEHLDRAHATHHEVVRTVRCAGKRFGGTATALRVGDCESSLTAHDYVGPYFSTYQYLTGTFGSQQHMIPSVVKAFDLKRNVTNMRANVITAVAWASKHGWGPWSCY